MAVEHRPGCHLTRLRSSCQEVYVDRGVPYSLAYKQYQGALKLLAEEVTDAICSCR